MAPTVCLPELSMPNNSSCYIRRRQRNLNSNGIVKAEQQRLELKRIFNEPANDHRVTSLSPPASPVWEPTCPTSSFLPTTNSGSNAISNRTTCGQDWRSILARREGLLDIVARTMALVRRSHMLQKRVNALRYETREFIRSVLNNPENSGGGNDSKSLGSSCGYVETLVSSSSEALSSRPMTPPPTPDSSSNGWVIATEDLERNNADTSYSNLSSPDCSSDESARYTNLKVTQDPMISSS